jgi:hypothetical protein
MSLVIGLGMLAELWPWPMAALSSAVAAAMARRVQLSSGSASLARERLGREAESQTVEISWKGVAALARAAVEGEGERFTSTVLADTNRIVDTCGGRRIRGSDLNGFYRFPDESSLEDCLSRLRRYQANLAEVLEQANAPVLELIVSRP